jgi:hypothetical protein|tara:strand:- start:546 stop:758 length:213 start_codon:yes stop_codon:yes gene_type:complete
MSVIKVKDHKNLVRDSRTKAVLNTDLVKMMQAKKRKQQSVTLETLTQEVNVIKDEFKEIKTLLRQIVAKR